jgi:hypothetical protein
VCTTHYIDNTRGIGGGTAPTSFGNVINMRTLIAIVEKAQSSLKFGSPNDDLVD